MAAENESPDTEDAEQEDAAPPDKRDSGVLSSAVFEKAVDHLAPKVPANAAGIVLLGSIAAGVLAVVSYSQNSTALLVLAAIVAFIAILYVILIFADHYLYPRPRTAVEAEGSGEAKADAASIQVAPASLEETTKTDEATKTDESPTNTIGIEELLDDGQHDAVCAAVAGAVAETANILSLESHLVRGNIFGKNSGGVLRILPGFSHNMQNKREATVRMPVGQGSTGRAWQKRAPNIAVRPTMPEGPDALASPEQMARIDPQLKWIVSVPVFLHIGDEPMWILNVDGLIDVRESEELERAVGCLLRWAEQVARILRSVLESN